ncbi:MAG: FHA domain-containing protein [Chloroflexota bacterium]
MQLYLHFEQNKQTKTYPLMDSAPLLIGKQHDCDIVINSESVSHKHLSICVLNGGLHICNLSPDKPTIIYTQSSLAPTQTLMMTPGLMFKLGLTRFMVQSISARANHYQTNPIQQLQLTTAKKRYHILEEDYQTIGHRNDCDIILSDQAISPYHAAIMGNHYGFYLHNLSQKQINYHGVKQMLWRNDMMPLGVGDVFKIGTTHFQVRSEPGTDSHSTTPIMKFVCPGCQRNIDTWLKDCPWCGIVLACSATISTFGA